MGKVFLKVNLCHVINLEIWNMHQTCSKRTGQIRRQGGFERQAEAGDTDMLILTDVRNCPQSVTYMSSPAFK